MVSFIISYTFGRVRKVSHFPPFERLMERSIRGMLHLGSNKWLEINSILFFLIEIFKGSLRIIIVEYYLLVAFVCVGFCIRTFLEIEIQK